MAMEKTSVLPGNKTVCLIALVLIACCTINSIFVLLYTNTQLMQMNERISKLEGKHEVPDNAEVENHETKIQRRSVLHHRDKRSANVTLDGVSKRLKTLENRINTALNNKINKDYWLLPLLKGRDGRDGRTGPPGPPGQPGQVGAQGIPGRQGQKGDSGKPGSTTLVTGPPGPKGQKGGPGSMGSRGPKGDRGSNSSVGVHYVRWGRTTCPSHAVLLYEGRIGGSHHLHTGSGSNYLCLPINPKYATYRDGHQGGAYIYGTEYETSFNGFSRNLFNHDAPCVVCYVPSRGSQLMYPARNDCPSEWTVEYWGYLMAERYSHKRSANFICVDKDAEYVPGSSGNVDESLLYVVEGTCGSLPCAPYVNGRELTCAVCSK